MGTAAAKPLHAHVPRASTTFYNPVIDCMFFSPLVGSKRFCLVFGSKNVFWALPTTNRPSLLWMVMCFIWFLEEILEFDPQVVAVEPNEKL